MASWVVRPEGRLIIAQRFIAGFGITHHTAGVPEGRLTGDVIGGTFVRKLPLSLCLEHKTASTTDHA